MKVLNRCGWISFLIILSACSFRPQPTVLQAAGPTPPGAGPSPKTANQGYLVVYSAWSSFVDPGFVGHHSRYIVSAQDGSFKKEIINYADRFDEGPIRLPLPPGAYQVTARAARAGRVMVPVIIKQHETTFVYLDGVSHRPLREDRPLDAVKLPNGQVVGWAANAGAAPPN